MRKTLSVVMTTAVVLVGAAVAPGAAGGQTPEPSEVVLHVAPDGRGIGCVEARPCDIDAVEYRVTRFSGVDAAVCRNVRVVLHGGTYYRDEPLRLDESWSGCGGASVRFENAPGEEPVLVGGRPIEGWEPIDGQIYRAYLPDVASGEWTFNQLFADGERKTLARTPNEGYLQVQAASATPQQSFIAAEGDLAEMSGADLASAQVYVWSFRDWFSNTVPVDSIDETTGEVSLADLTVFPTEAGDRYYIQGVRSALDSPGEFYLDRAAGYVYYWPEGDISAQTVVAPTVENVIEVVGTSPDSPVTDLVISGVDVQISAFPDYYQEIERVSLDRSRNVDCKVDVGTVFNRPADRNVKGLVFMENVEDVSVVDSTLTNAGLHAVAVKDHGQRVRVERNVVRDPGYAGVLLQGAPAGTLVNGTDQLYDNKDNVVADNVVSDVGRLVGHGAGVFINQSGDNEIIHNEISNSPRYGVTIRGVGFCEMPYQYGDIDITLENRKQFLTSRDNLVANNRLHHLGQDSIDMGMISTVRPGVGNQIIDNHISDGDGQQIIGIYLDDESQEFRVEGNVIHDIRGVRSEPLLAKGERTQ